VVIRVWYLQGNGRLEPCLRGGLEPGSFVEPEELEDGSDGDVQEEE